MSSLVDVKVHVERIEEATKQENATGSWAPTSPAMCISLVQLDLHRNRTSTLSSIADHWEAALTQAMAMAPCLSRRSA